MEDRRESNGERKRETERGIIRRRKRGKNYVAKASSSLSVTLRRGQEHGWEQPFLEHEDGSRG